MTNDVYASFTALFAHEKPGIDYNIFARETGSPILILAPHGGKIEPGTSEIAAAIAGNDLSIFRFEGVKVTNNRVLHVTSHRYDEPRANAMVRQSRIVVAIHGRKDGEDPETVWLGGLDALNRGKVERELQRARFIAAVETREHAGLDPQNICNRGITGQGVQLEIPRSLRVSLTNDPARLSAFSTAIRKALLSEGE